MSRAGALARKLEAVLSDEYHALLGGRIEDLEGLGAKKLDTLEKAALLPEQEFIALEPLRAKLLRNQLLVQSALEGMRVALERAREINEISKGLKTYRSDGSPQKVGLRAGSHLSKRS